GQVVSPHATMPPTCAGVLQCGRTPVLHPSEQAFETQLPLPSQVCRMSKLAEHRDSVPEHSLQLPPMHTGVLPPHALPATHVPPTQNSGVLAFLQRLWLFTHAQAPLEQTGVSPEHVVSFCHVRCALHDCGVEPLQRLSPRLHSTHWPPKQIGVLP